MSDMKRPGYLRELAVYQRLFPPLFCSECEPMSVLYVGAVPDHVNFVPELREAGHYMMLLEIDADGAHQLEDSGLFDYIKVGDVAQLSRQRYPHKPDVIFWRFGPEHVERKLYEPIDRAMEKLAEHVVIVTAPSGPTPWHRPDLGREPGMEHKSVPEIPDYKAMGYHVEIIPSGTGKSRGDGAMFVAWKWTGMWKWPPKYQ